MTQIFWVVRNTMVFNFILFLISVSFFESLRLPLAKGSSTFSPSPSSIVFTTPSVPLVGDRNLRKRGCNRPPVLRTATLYGWRGIKTLAMLCGMGPPCFSLLIGTARIVPHCSIALRLSPLEWGILFLFYFWEDYLWRGTHQGYGGNLMTAIGI